MRIGCVQDNGINESLALTELAGLLKSRGDTLEVFLADEEPNLEQALHRFGPDALLLPADVGGHHRFRGLCEQLRRSFDCPFVSGGIYPTLYDEEFSRDLAVDYFIVGEAEIPLPQLLDALERGDDPSGIPGVCGKYQGKTFRNSPPKPVADLDSLPLPDRGLYYKYPFLRDFPLKRFTTGRGCSYTCSYCWNPVLQEAYPKGTNLLRRKSVGRVIEEVNHVRSLGSLRSIHFSDDLFVTSKAWLQEFAERFPREVGVTFTCNTTFEGMKPWAIETLAQAGCRAVAMALESGSDELRKEMLNRSLTNEKAAQVAEALGRSGIQLVTFNMLGIPGQSTEDALQSLELNASLKAFHSRVTMTVTFPRADIARRSKERALLQADTGATPEGLQDYTQGWQGRRESTAFHNLMYIYPLAVRWPWLRRLAPTLMRMPRMPMLQLFQLFSFWREKTFFGLDLLSLLPYYLHTYRSMPRTKNYVTLI